VRINNVEFELNLAEPKVLENVRIEIEAFNHTVDQINQMNISTMENSIRKEILACVSLERILGYGAGEKIFHDGISITKCENIMKQFNREINKEYSQLKGIVIKFPLRN
jgi:hypothetical protein